MENQQIKLFTHEQFGKVRVVTIDDDPWFVGKDVAAALGYKLERKAIRDHIDDEDKRGVQIGTPYGVQNMTLINESGMYALIFGSKLEKAREFKHWVTSVVLPSIRKTGSYSLASEPVAEFVERKNHAVIPEYACVYALLLSDGTVKIGCSGNPRTRVAKIKRESKLTVDDLYISPFMPCKVARLVEWVCQEKFSSRRVKGEIFSVKFDEACAAIDSFVNAVALPLVFKNNIIVANIIAGRKSK